MRSWSRYLRSRTFIFCSGLMLSQKLQELCRLKLREMRNKVEEEQPGPKPSANAPETRPHTLRIKNIPISCTKEDVQYTMSTVFDSTPSVHSLAPYNLSHSCATATFPHKDHNFPIRMLTDNRSRLLNSKLHYDIDFLGLTPLHDSRDAVVE